jgi:hypothetical protein
MIGLQTIQHKSEQKYELFAIYKEYVQHTFIKRHYLYVLIQYFCVMYTQPKKANKLEADGPK